MDFSKLEAVKENAAPSRRGHSAKQLLSQDSPNDNERIQLEEALSRSDLHGDDPLEPHYRLLCWYNNAYPMGPPVKQYSKILENAARLFRKDARYKNDVRFVSIWLQVAKRAPEQEDVFKYMQSNGIGVACASFYEEYAALLEIRGRFKEADSIYKLGISHSAAPLDRLRNKYDSFQHRMMIPQKKEQEPDVDEELAPEIVRPVLKSSASVHQRTSHILPAQSSQTVAYKSYSSYGAGSTINLSKPVAANSQPQKIAVFKDDASMPSNSIVLPNQWEDYGTKASQTKENAIQAQKWTDTNISEACAVKSNGGSKLRVFSDDGVSKNNEIHGKFDDRSNVTKVLSTVHTSDMKSRVQSLISETHQQESISAAQSIATTPRVKQPSKLANENMASNLSEIYANDREYSFEEIRARKIGSKKTTIENLPYAQAVTTPIAPPLKSAPQSPLVSLVSKVAEPVSHSPHQIPVLPVSVSASQIIMSDGRFLPQSVPTTAPTSAMAGDISGLTGTALQAALLAAASSNSDLQDSSDESDEDAEVDRELERLTRLNTMGNKQFSTDVTEDLGTARNTNFKEKAVASPTINTKAALADVYEMFNAKLPHENQVKQHQEDEIVKDNHDLYDEGDQIVSVKHGLDDKPEWYEIEADETISKKLIQPQSMRLKENIFLDNGMADDNAGFGGETDFLGAAPKQKMSIFNDENEILNAHAVKPARKPLGVKEFFQPKPSTPVVDPQSPFFDEPDASVTGTDSNKSETRNGTPTPKESKSKPELPSARDQSQNLPPVPENLYTPHHRIVDDGSFVVTEDSVTDTQEYLRNHHEVHFPQHNATSRTAVVRPQDLMTPIAEASFEYETRTFGGLSTIASARSLEDMTQFGRESSILGRDSLTGGSTVRRFGNGASSGFFGDAPATILPKKHYQQKLQEHFGERLKGENEDKSHTFSSISLVSSREQLSSVDVSSSYGEDPATDSSNDSNVPKAILSTAISTLQSLDILSSADLSYEDKVTPEGKPDAVNCIESQIETPFVIPNPCNPNSREIQSHILKTCDLQITEMKGYMDLNRMSPQPITIGQKIEDALEKDLIGGGLCQIQLAPNKVVRFRIMKKVDSMSYIARELKSGLFSQSLVEDEELELEADDEDDETEVSSSQRQFIIKVERPADTWEFYVLETLRFRLPERVLTSVAKPISCHVFADVSCLRTEYCSDLSLKEAINLSVKQGYGSGVSVGDKDGGVDELLAAFWSIELLRTIEAIHVSGFLHGSISIENIMLRLGSVVSMTGDAGYWDAKYDPSGCGGWLTKGLLLVGFNRAVDLFAFPVDQMFIGGDSKCWESRTGVASKYEPEWYAVANIVYWMLFGKELQVLEDASGEGKPIMKPAGQLKRYWQLEMWNKLFDVLLNLERATPASSETFSKCSKEEEFTEFCQEFPPALRIREVRLEMEQWLVGSCSKAGKSLKSLLQRVEMASLML